MARTKQDTLPFGVGEDFGEVRHEYDRTKLSSTPLARLVGSTHMVYGKQNLLHGFDERLDNQLSKHDGKYRELIKERRNLEEMISCVLDQTEVATSTAKLLQDLDNRIRQERASIVPEIKTILVKAYREAFVFLIDHLDDQNLATLKVGISQYTIAQILYDNLDSYEDRYALGKEIRLQILQTVKEQAAVRGANILRNVLPGTNIEAGGRARRPLVTSAPIPKTMRPAPFIPKTEEEIRAGVEAERRKQNKLINPPMDFPQLPIAPSIRRETLRYGAGMQDGSLIVPNGISPEIEESYRETQENAERISREISAINSQRLPDLQGLFDSLEEPDPEIQKIIKESAHESVEQLPELPIEVAESPNLIKEVSVERESLPMDKVTDTEEITAITRLPAKKSWYQRAANSMVEKTRSIWSNARQETAKATKFITNKITGGWNWLGGKLRRNWKGMVLAGSVAAGGLALYNSDSVQNTEKPVASSQGNSAVQPNPTNLTIDTPNPTLAPATSPEVKTRATFAKVLTDSKSPLVQDIINQGKFKLGGNTVIDTMIDSFKGLANDAQKAQLRELQKEINLGLSTYFYENFGTPAKVAAAMKDPKLRNLYRTAKVAQAKGWFNSTHTKARFPKAYALAEQILADSSKLGIDESNNPNKAVQDFARGNMFQAKLPGNTVNLRKADGSYHIVEELVFQIFEGKKVSDALNGKFSGGSTKSPVIDQKPEKNKQPQVNPQEGQGKTGILLPNLDKPDAPADPGHIDRVLGQKRLLQEIEMGWDEIIDNEDKLAGEKMALEKTSRVGFELPLHFTTREENMAIIPAVADKIASLHPQADTDLVRKLIRQYGFIGFKLVSRERGHFVVELAPNFHKNILKPLLQKKVRPI